MDINNLLKFMGDQCEKEHGIRPMFDSRYFDALGNANLHYQHKICRMWILYINDPEEIQRGIDLGYFLRTQVLNRYAFRVPRDSQKSVSGVARGNIYMCENRARPLKQEGIHCGNAGMWLDSDMDCREKPCEMCNGRMLRQDLWDRLRLEILGFQDEDPVSDMI